MLGVSHLKQLAMFLGPTTAALNHLKSQPQQEVRWYMATDAVDGEIL
jgi:hypothetical protein